MLNKSIAGIKEAIRIIDTFDRNVLYPGSILYNLKRMLTEVLTDELGTEDVSRETT